MGDLPNLHLTRGHGLSPIWIADEKNRLVCAVPKHSSNALSVSQRVLLAASIPYAVRVLNAIERIITAFDGREGDIWHEIDSARALVGLHRIEITQAHQHDQAWAKALEPAYPNSTDGYRLRPSHTTGVE